MSLNNFFTPSELARETGQGESSVRFWLNRFSQWLPHAVDRGQKLYTRESLATLLVIAEKIDAGMIPSEIETLLEDRAFNTRKQAKCSQEKQPPDTFGNKSLEMIQSILGTMTGLQERIATAQERRAGAEEKKAMALERRAEAEEKKATAMNAIAAALNGMNKAVSDGGGIKNAMLEATRNIPLENPYESNQPDSRIGDLIKDTDDLSKLVENEPDLDDPDLNEVDDEFDNKFSMDDLSKLFNDEPVQDLGFKDLNLDDLTLKVEDEQDQIMDDLSLLVEDEQDQTMDDLSLLVEDKQDQTMDDLSLLVEDKQDQTMDDLSLLVEDKQDQTMDDLSLLVNDRPGKDTEKSLDNGYLGLDDLGMLVEEEQPSIKPNITPQDNFELYKSEIINIIIKLKNQGLSVEETTERFNMEGILTLSGKSGWSSKPINQIYKFIDAAKK